MSESTFVQGPPRSRPTEKLEVQETSLGEMPVKPKRQEGWAGHAFRGMEG